jgi:SAM-dependent methyltransferase
VPEPSNLSTHAARNREVWNADAPNWVANGRKSWASPTPWWGMWEIPEEELQILPDVAGLDVLDLGCGTGYWCAWLARLGARPVGLDLSEEQLATARELQVEHGIEFPLIHASAEAPPLPDASFDIVFSEYGAAIWCDPYAWIPQAHRLLRPGGRLIFLGNALLVGLCSPLSNEPTGETLVRPQLGLGAIEWPDDDGIDFHQPHGERIKLLRDTGFEIEALHELYAPDGDPDEVRYFMRRGWAQKWPCEAVWVARRTDR